MISRPRLALAYLAVILIWSTTPLAIKWSSEGPGYLFGVTARMSLGLIGSALILLLSGRSLPLNRRARLSYLAGAVQIYGAMLATYWAAPKMPSGWISVVFGLSPLMTAFMAAAWLGERALSPIRLVSYVIGVGGLAVMYHLAWHFGGGAELGVVAVLGAAFLQSISAVWVKRIDARVPATAQVTGSLVLALPIFLLTYAASGPAWPPRLDWLSAGAILYLGAFATPFGFALYFFVLVHLPATRVALITLITPVLALILGHQVNHEPLDGRIRLGAALILGALLLHEWAARRRPERIITTRGRNSGDNVP